MKISNFFKWRLGIDKLEKRITILETQVKLTMDRAQWNNLRTLMMLEHGDFPMLDGRIPLEKSEKDS